MKLAVRITTWLAGLLILAVLAGVTYDFYLAARMLGTLSSFERKNGCRILFERVTIPDTWQKQPVLPPGIEAKWKQLRSVIDSPPRQLQSKSDKRERFTGLAEAWNAEPDSATTTRVRRLALDLAHEGEYDFSAAGLDGPGEMSFSRP